jgi:hypothetical protein
MLRFEDGSRMRSNARVERPATMIGPRKDAAHDESRPLQRDVRLHAVDYAVCDSEMMPEAATPGTAPAWGSKSTAPELDPGTCENWRRRAILGRRDRSHRPEQRNGACPGEVNCPAGSHAT